MCVYTSAFSDVILSFINSMSQIPGIMSKMPPLPVSVDERLASYILPRSPMVNFFCFPHDLQPGAALIVRFLGTDVKIQDQKYTLILTNIQLPIIIHVTTHQFLTSKSFYRRVDFLLCPAISK